MYTDQCLCIQISFNVYRPVFMYTDQCLCVQTSVSQNVHLSVTSPRLYGGPQTNKTTLRIKDNRTLVRVGFEVNEMAALRYSPITNAM